MLKTFLSKNKLILLYGISLALLLALLKWLELKFIIMEVLPVGFLFTIASALILKKKPKLTTN